MSVRHTQQSVILIGLESAVEHSRDIVPGVMHVNLALTCRSGPGCSQPDPIAEIDDDLSARRDEILNARIRVSGICRENVGRTWHGGTRRDLTEANLSSLEKEIVLCRVAGDVDRLGGWVITNRPGERAARSRFDGLWRGPGGPVCRGEAEGTVDFRTTRWSETRRADDRVAA